jgi:excinuclease ABC subunit C
MVLVSEELPERGLLAEALSTKNGHPVEVSRPKRGEKRDVVDHALANAREALGRKLAETSSQQALLKSFAELFGLPALPRRIEVYDNSHIQGSNAVGALVVAGPEGFVKNQYRKFNIRSDDLTPGDDFGMMREVLERRFKRLLSEHPRASSSATSSPPPLRGRSASEASREGGELQIAVEAMPPLPNPPPQGGREQLADTEEHTIDISRADTPWPDLVLIDGGQGQLTAAREALTQLGVTDVPLVAIAKGKDRDAGRETFFMAGREPFRLPPRDPLLYFIERLRDEAHRFAIGSHRTRRKRDIREGGLQEIPGIGPTRKRALLNHFGTLKAIERASLGDLTKVPGINADTARRIYNFFHERPA